MDSATGVNIEMQRQLAHQQELLQNVLLTLEEEGLQGGGEG